MVFRKDQLILFLAVISLPFFSGCHSEDCPHSCPSPTLGLGIVVHGGPAALTGVDATLSGPTTVTLSCQASTQVGAASCFWPLSTPLTAGAYTMVVNAPGFRSSETSVTVSMSDDRCGCSWGDIQPSTVTLVPSP
jgi:hypothetical protein